jgi:DNA invertase Pin-like site-specific DNA recombinase
VGGLGIIKVAKGKEVGGEGIKGNWSLNGTIETKSMAQMLGLIREVERDFIGSRTKEALGARKAAGVVLGRPRGPGKSKLDQYRPEIEALLANGSTKAYIAKRYKTTPANLHNWLSKNEIKIANK